MVNPALHATLLVLALMPLSAAVRAHPIVTESKPGIAEFIDAQSAPGWERCRWLRHHARELEYRVAYAPPWERERLNSRLAETRHQLWGRCRGSAGTAVRH